MIGLRHANTKDRIAGKSCDDDALVSSSINNGGLSGSAKKPSLLRSQLLRRKKRSPQKAMRTAVEENKNIIIGAASSTIDVPPEMTSSSSTDTISSCQETSNHDNNDATTRKRANDTNSKSIQITEVGDGKENIQDNTSTGDCKSFHLHKARHDEEHEIKNGKQSDSDDESGAFNISMIESDEGDEEESKTEAETDSSQSLKTKQPCQQTSVKTATVSTSNLSIVVTGNDIIVEYRDVNEDERKEPSSVQKQQLAPHRPKGIMKRRRDSNITYHHPRRPLPPPIPPPGYRDISSPLSWMTATTADSSDSYLTAPPTAITTTKKKRVSFDEDVLKEQLTSSRLRRQARNDYERSFVGILSMAMPVFMPYLIAVLILIVSSMIPLPPPQQGKQSSLSMSSQLSSQLELVNDRNEKGGTCDSTIPTSPSIFADFASRCWEERVDAKEATSSLYSIEGNGESTFATMQMDSIAVAVDGSTISNDSSESSDLSTAMEVYDPNNVIAMTPKFVFFNPVAQVAATLFDIFSYPETRSVSMLMDSMALAIAGGNADTLDTSNDSKAAEMETPENAIAVLTKFDYRNPVVRTVATVFRYLRAMLFPFKR